MSDTATIDGTATEVPQGGAPEYAFVVIKNKEGGFQVGDFASEEVKPERQPTIDDIFAATSIIQKDLTAQQTAMTVITMMQNAARAAAGVTEGGVALPGGAAPSPLRRVVRN